MSLKLLFLIRKNKRILVWVVLLSLATLTFSATATLFIINFRQMLAEMGFWSWALFFLITCFTMALALTPTTFIALVTGYFLGLMALPGLVLAYLIASVIGYFLSMLIDNGRFLSSIKELPGSEKVIEGIESNNILLIVLARLSPVFPFALMNILLAILKTNLWKFTWAGFLGMLPRTILFVWTGMQFNELSNLVHEGEKAFYTRLSTAILIFITILGIGYLIKKIIKKQVNEA